MVKIKILILFLAFFVSLVGDGVYRLLPSSSTEEEEEIVRTKTETTESSTIWVLLIAGSHGFKDYSDQADICHAYHIFKDGGIEDKNIIVFMYDDIAYNQENYKAKYGRFGRIFNEFDGKDVYQGVPKDYTGKQVNVHNVLAVLRGEKSGVVGGSGKVIESTSFDRVFVYFASHGGPGILAMPHQTYFTREQLLGVLKDMNMRKRYRSMAIYISACHSGSMIRKAELAPHILVVTSANKDEKSFKTHCHRERLFLHCLATHFGVTWMEDSETHNRRKRSLEQQIEMTRDEIYMRIIGGEKKFGSHVSEYGAKQLKQEKLHLYQGFDPNGPL